jgi:hypothetical protein
MNVSELEPYHAKRHRLYQLCANTQTAERLCEAINASADVHNLYPWSVVRCGNVNDIDGVTLAIISHRTWDVTPEEGARASAYLKRVYPLHPGDIDLSRMTARLNPYAGQDRYRQLLPESGRKLARHREGLAATKAAKHRPQSRQDGTDVPVAVNPAILAQSIDDLLAADTTIEF